MRKFYLLFALLIGISSAAWADSFSPTEGAVYVIKVINNENGTNVDYYATYNASATSGSNNVLTAARKYALTVNSFFVVEAIDDDGATNGFTIRLKSDDTRYVYAISTDGGTNGDANVGTKVVSESEIPDDCKWQINVVSVSEGIYNIIPKSGSASWNVRGTASGYKAIGQWTSTGNQNCKWYIQTPADLASECATQYTFENKVAFPAESWMTEANSATTKATTLNTTWSEDNASAFAAAWNTYYAEAPLLLKPTSTSGLFKIQNKHTSKYLYQDEVDEKGLTRANDGGDNAKYYFKVNFAENANSATIVNSQGKYPLRGSAKPYASANPLIFGENGVVGLYKPEGGFIENYFAFPYEALYTNNDNTINNAAYNSETNPAFVYHYAGGYGAAKQYQFVPVTLADGEQIYTVNVDRSVYNCDAKVTYNSDSYTGNKSVFGGGFYVLSGTVDASSFSAVNTNENPYYVASVAIDGTNINVTYTFNTALQAEDYVAASTANKLGYPAPTSTVARELKAALETYNSAETEENLTTLNTKLTAYMNATTDITMPVDGKAYKITAVFPTGVTNTLYWNESSTAFKAKNESAISDELSKVLVCRANADGTFTFVSNSGKYLLWFCDSNNAINQSGYSDEYSTDNNWTLERAVVENKGSGSILTGTTNADFVGRFQIKAKGKNGNNWYLNARYANNTDDATFISQYAGDKFFDNNWNSDNHYRTYTYTFEEVDYANIVNFKDASSLETGKNIATFSAPFPTVVPENTTAYTVETTSGTNVTKVALQEAVTAGNAIPANQGVILIGTATGNVTMLPRTTEAITDIANNGLSHTAGAAVDVNDGNSYVLANKSSEGWAFYKVSTTATSQLPMNKAYLHLTAAPETIRFDFGNATGIDAIGTDNKAESKIYDLSGRAVKTMSKGLYIVDGKKVIK